VQNPDHVQKSRRLPAVAVALACLALALALGGCGGSPTKHRAIAAVEVGSGAGFDPTTITVDKDDNVVLTVGNTTAKTHGFTIEGYGIVREVNTGNPVEVKFKSSKPGTFKIYCQLHPTHGIATLVVQ